jgi:hypothetical protein
MRKILVGLATVGLAAILVIAAVRLLNPAIGPSVPGVSAERLSQSGIVMLNPFPWDPPQLTKGQAEQVALKQAPGGTVLQTVLAEVILTNPSATTPRLCWVVSLPGSLIMSHGPPGSRQRTANWYVILIDAHSGEFVQGSAGG